MLIIKIFDVVLVNYSVIAFEWGGRRPRQRGHPCANAHCEQVQGGCADPLSERACTRRGRRQVGESDHIETVGAVAGQLVDQAEFPIQIGLHGFLGIVGAFVRATVAVDARRGQVGFTFFQW